MNPLEAALYYSKELKWSVIPVKVYPNGNGKVEKKPLLTWGEFQNRIATEEEIQSWYQRWPDAGVGIVTGKISNLVVLDVDLGGDVSDFEINTVSVKTGSGGKHFYFKYPKDYDIRNSASLVRKHIDIRGEGGYVVAPPSKYAGNAFYEWINSPKDKELSEFPRNILKEKSKDIWQETGIVKQYEQETIKEGEGRNNAATSYVGYLLNQVASNQWETLVWPALQQWNQTKCSPPLSLKELRTIFDSMVRTDLRNNPNKEERKEEKSETFNPITVKDLLAMDFPEIQWQVDRLIPKGQITVISGPPSSHKSMIAAEIAIRCSKGEKIFNNFNSSQSSVLIVNEDGDNLRNFKKRLVSLGATDQMPIYLSIGANLKIGNKDIEKLINYIKEKDIKFIILDSFRALLPTGLKENEAGDVRQAINNIRPITQYGVSILLIHHDRKKPIGLPGYISTDPNDLGEMMAGSVDIRGAIDCHIAMASKRNEENDYTIVMTQTKCREDEMLPAFKVLFKKEENYYRFIHNGLYNEAEDTINRAKRAILNYFSSNKKKDYISVEEIIESKIAGLKERTIREVLRKLEEEGYINHKTAKELQITGSPMKHFYYLIEKEKIETEKLEF